MGFAQCELPLWRVEDFTHCFQQDYLKTALPLFVIVTSFSLLLAQNAVRSIKARRRRKGYEAVAAVPRLERITSHTEIPPDEGNDPESDTAGSTEGSDEDGGGHGLTIGGGRITLARTNTKGSIVQADAPPAQTLSVAVEEAAILGLVIVNAIALGTGAWGREGSVAAITGLVVWLYVLVLASLRLFLGTTVWRVPRLWNHTAFIYGAQWFFTVIIFRSVIIKPSSRLTQVLVIIEFAFTTVLFGLALTTRKGNKTILLEWENGIPPSREKLASLLSLATFAWTDQIIWEGWREPLTIDRVWNLLPRDKATTVLANYRRVQKRFALWLHMLGYFKGLLSAQFLWAIFGGIFVIAPTLLLKKILECVENPESAPLNVLWLYVILLPFADLARALGENQALWIGRKICINVRAILVGEIYAKALRRKAASGKDSVLGENKDAKTNAKKGLWGRFKAGVGLGERDLAKKAKDAKTTNKDEDKEDEASDEQANLGTIINLMSVDSFKVSETTAYLHFLVAHAPTQLVVTILLLYQLMGLSAIPGFIVMILLLPVNIAFGKGFNSTQKTIMMATDKRIHITNEVLSNIRVIKYFAWEARFSDIVDEKRRAELKALRNRFILWAFAVMVWNTVPILITFFTFLSYTIIEKKPLYPSIAFTAISLFMLLRNPLDQIGDMIAHVQESKVSVDRIEEFLSEEETEKFEQLGLDNTDEQGKQIIGFRDATFIWGSKDAIAEDGSMAFRLLDLNLDFKIGKLNVITGPTGSGKTSMLMALLGEMSHVAGRVFLPGGRSREDVRPDPETGLAETCAYVAQQAWLVNASIKDNIIFAAPLDEARYRDVIVACALERDLEILDNGDETLVGEKGITLSGGQKQRISLARAVYSNSRHLLLDDCLSAVDSHTAQWIFNNCITGPLMKGRTCILVSHNIPLTVPHAEFVVMLNNGRVDASGSAQDIIATGKLGDEIQKSRPGSASVSQIPSRVPSSLGESKDTLVDKNGNGHDALSGGTSKAPKKHAKQNAMDEEKATGSVPWPVVKLYLTSLGGWGFWLVALVVFGVQQGTGVASNVWVKEWANQYTTEPALASVMHVHGKSSDFSAQVQHLAPIGLGPMTNLISSPRNGTALAAVMQPEVNANYYLLILGLVGLVGALTALLRDIWLFFGSLNASKRIHSRLMEAVSSAKFKFFDVTPLGQMMNRFSKDLENIDQELAPVAIGTLSCALAICITICLIAVITPGFLIAAVFITAAYVGVGIFYLQASRDLKRLESVQRSPLFQQFGETLSGVTTIRAYGDERRFVRDNLAHINKQIRPFIYMWAANRWLAIRTDILGDLVAFFAGVFVIFSLGKVDAGSAGLSLSYAIGFADNILWLVRLYAMNEQNMNSVERIKEYLDVEREAAAVVETNRPPANWPANGAVEFINYSTRYRAELEPVLRNLTFKIAPRQKVGIVGRTGAGKSSLALALFRALEADPDGGKILVDGLDIGLIGLRDLREKITIVPQDPTLFMGTIRSNIDPFGLYSDAEVFEVLRRVQLLGEGEGVVSSAEGAAETVEEQIDQLVDARQEDPATAPAESMGLAAGALPAANAAQADNAPPTPTIAITSEDLPTTTTIDTSAAPATNGASVPPTPTSIRSAAATNKNPFTDLSSPVSESGSNLSQGQRQLLCLARALLRKPTVLVMDEATASIDYATDGKIQDTIRQLDATIITIAHRLKTIVDYDLVLVLDAGRVVERGPPWLLLGDETDGTGDEERKGIFKSMCEQSGDLDVLKEKAKEAWERGRLVDA